MNRNEPRNHGGQGGVPPMYGAVDVTLLHMDSTLVSMDGTRPVALLWRRYKEAMDLRLICVDASQAFFWNPGRTEFPL